MSEKKQTRRQPESPLLPEFLSGEAGRVLDALWAVVGTRDPEVLAPLVTARPAITKATKDLKLGGILVSNSSNLEHALDRIDLFSKGVCLCVAYVGLSYYNPAQEEQRQHVRIVGTVANDRQWAPDRICECRDCGKRYQVEEGQGHVTWWKWTKVD
jgi:hypothetical protein